MEYCEDELRINNSCLKPAVSDDIHRSAKKKNFKVNDCSDSRDHDDDDESPPDDENFVSSRRTLPGFDAFIMPTELYISFNSDPGKKKFDMLSKKDRLEFLPHGHHSTPASPEELERTKAKQSKDLSSLHSPITDKKIFSYGGFVRTSKSEDHLQKSSMTTVNIDIEEEMASSLDTLLDTKPDDDSDDDSGGDDIEDLASYTIGMNCEERTVEESSARAQSPVCSPTNGNEMSPSSSETSSPSKISVKYTEIPESRQLSARQHSDSSGSEIIPSESSPTIRKDESECSEGECTSEQISAISSLEGSVGLSCPDDSAGESPAGSLSPGAELQLDDDWLMSDVLTKDPAKTDASLTTTITAKTSTATTTTAQVSPTKSKNNSRQTVLSAAVCSLPVEVNEPSDRLLTTTQQQQHQQDRTPSFSSSLSVPRAEVANNDSEKRDQSAESPTSPCSEDTFADVSYHELTESYDEDSFAEPEDDSIAAARNNNPSPPDSTTDDESDIESLHSFHYSPKAVDLPSASRLAKRLYNLDGFKKTDVSRHLSKNNEFSKAVAEEYLKFFDFTEDSLDVALRKFLSQFCLIGETQERERVLVHFSKHYLDCNPGTFRSQDAVHTLTCALMLLNSDLHSEISCRKMVCGEFIENLSDLNDGENFPRDVLKSLYHSIKTQPLEWAARRRWISYPDMKSSLFQPLSSSWRTLAFGSIPQRELGDDDKKNNSNGHGVQEPRQSYIGHNPFLEVPNPNCATEYKKGYVMRKCCIDPSGKKTPLGRRSWKMLYATLKDLVLYLHKDEHGFKKNQLYDSLHNSIRIHHAFAEKASDYTKKQYVFRLRTADQAVYLFQTSDSKELDSWVDAINLVAASLSSPSLPAGLGSQRKFQRPLLPVSHTKMNLREQLQDHENRVIWLEKEYEEHLNKTSERTGKSRFVHEHAEKESHLLYELTRYRTYAYLLRSRMAQYPELDTPLVQTSIGEVEEPVERHKSSNSSQKSPVHVKKQRSLSVPMEKDISSMRQKLTEETNISD